MDFQSVVLMEKIKNIADLASKIDRMFENMRAERKAADAGKKAIKAFYPEFLEGFDPLDPAQKAGTASREHERMEEESEERQRKSESWHTFKTPWKT